MPEIRMMEGAGQVCLDEERGIHVATAERAIGDLKRVGRNLELLSSGNDEGKDSAAPS